MDYILRQKRLFDRNHLEEVFPVRGFDPETDLFWTSGDDENSYICAAWLCNPVSGVSEDKVKILESCFSSDLPTETLLSFSLVSSTFVTPVIQYYRKARLQTINDRTDPDKAALARGIVDNRISLLMKGIEKPLDNDSKVLLKDKYQIVTMKIKASFEPSREEFDKVQTLAISMQQTLESLDFYPQSMDHLMFLALTRGILYPGRKPSNDFDEYKELNEQIFDIDTDIEVGKEHLKIGDTWVRSLSVQRYPQQTALPIMSYLVGDPMGSQNQIACPFMITTHIYFPDPHKAKQMIDKKARAVRVQNLGKLGRLVPKLGIKDQNFTILTQSLENGNNPIQVWTNLLVFAESQESMIKQSSQAKNFWEVHGFKLSVDNAIQGPAFQQQMPMCITPDAVKLTHRFCTMTVEHGVHLIPCIGCWKGNGTGANNIFYSRRGQVVLYDPFDSDTNMNTCVFGESGSGKSVLTNDVALGTYTRGGIVRIIDSGNSYKKTTAVVGGEFIEFSPNANIIINPFTDVKDIKKELPALLVILEQMAAPKTGLTDYQLRAIEKYTLEAFNEYGNELNITILHELLVRKGEEDKDEEIRKMGHQLFAFSRHGSFGKYFDGAANLTMSGDWSVLELDDLADQKELRTIVLLLMISKLNKDFYNGDRSQRKLLIVDEFWKYGLEDDIGSKRIQDFMIGAFRLFRKYFGSAMICTQACTDLGTDGNSPLLQNSANVIVMKQKPESVDALKRQQILSLSDYTFELLKTVRRKGTEYSDLFIYTSGRGFGVCRFMIDRFTQLLYTTNPQEVSKLNILTNEGRSIPEAINEYMRLEKSQSAK